MLVTQTDIFAVPVGISTVLTIREVSSRQRTLWVKNLVAQTLSLIVEYSLDGGANWTTIETFSLTTLNEIHILNIEDTGILRVRGSGGSNDRDLAISYSRIYDTVDTWTNPTL